MIFSFFRWAPSPPLLLMAQILNIINLSAADLSWGKNVGKLIQEDLTFLKDSANVDEIEEVLLTFHKKLLDHADDYERAVEHRDPYSIFSQAFKDIRSNSVLKEISVFYLQKYYDDQLSKLLVRLDRQRSTGIKVLTNCGLRASTTQESIKALHIFAGIYNLNITTETGYVEKVVKFFAQDASAKTYFYNVFSSLKSKNEQREFLEIGLKYLFQRYQFDRSNFSKFLEYLGVKTSQTREAAQTLVRIAQDFNITLSENYIQQLDQVDQEFLMKMIEIAAE